MDYTTPSSSLADSVPSGTSKIEETLVASVSACPPSRFIGMGPFSASLACSSAEDRGPLLVPSPCVLQVALPHSLPLPRREALQQSSTLSTVSPATVDLTLKVAPPPPPPGCPLLWPTCV